MREEIKFERHIEKMERRTKQIWFLNILMMIVGLMILPFNVLVVPPMMLMAFMVGLIINMLNIRE